MQYRHIARWSGWHFGAWLSRIPPFRSESRLESRFRTVIWTFRSYPNGERGCVCCSRAFGGVCTWRWGWRTIRWTGVHYLCRVSISPRLIHVSIVGYMCTGFSVSCDRVGSFVSKFERWHLALQELANKAISISISIGGDIWAGGGSASSLRIRVGGWGAGFDGVWTRWNKRAIRWRVRGHVIALSPRGRERDLIDTQGSQSDLKESTTLDVESMAKWKRSSKNDRCVRGENVPPE